eukprot:2844363-Rhodomonas_salina.2
MLYRPPANDNAVQSKWKTRQFCHIEAVDAYVHRHPTKTERFITHRHLTATTCEQSRAKTNFPAQTPAASPAHQRISSPQPPIAAVPARISFPSRRHAATAAAFQQLSSRPRPTASARCALGEPALE